MLDFFKRCSWRDVRGMILMATPCAAQQRPLQQHRKAILSSTTFKFRSGESLPELRLHYTTLGKPARDAQGRTTNAVLILHGTGGTGHQFLQPQFAGVLFGPGQLLDASRYFIILPDGIGHGKSSKPSDGLHAHFPQYDYDDMVAAHYRCSPKASASTTCASSWALRWAACIPSSGARRIPISWTR